MTAIIESPPAIGLKQHITSLPEPKIRRPKRVPGRFERPRGAAGTPEPAAILPRQTCRTPLRAASGDSLDAWARHAAASNGFGDTT